MQRASTLGQRLGPYELMHKISVGGMAETFLARRRGPGGFEQQVCIKRVLPAFAEDKEFARLFLDEAKLAAQLRHTNIVQVYDFGVEDDTYYMALELIEGMDMRHLLRVLGEQDRTMAPKLVAIIATEIASALEYAHHLEINGKAAGIVHRDISPSNVLLSYTGSIKLADFGIAKATTHAHVTRSGVVKGKVPYMAPEHATGAEIDARSDLFSLGVLLYEALAGFRPYDGPNDVATLTNLINGKYKPLAEAAPEAPKHFADIIEKLLNADPDKRYQSAGELLDALVLSAPPSTTRRALGTLVKEARSTQPTPVELAKTSTSSGVISRPSDALSVSDASEESQESSPNERETKGKGSWDLATRTKEASADPSGQIVHQTPSPATPAITQQEALAETVAAEAIETPAPLSTSIPSKTFLSSVTLPEFVQKRKAPFSVLAIAIVVAGITLALLWQKNTAMPVEKTEEQQATVEQTTPPAQSKTAAAQAEEEILNAAPDEELKPLETQGEEGSKMMAEADSESTPEQSIIEEEEVDKSSGRRHQARQGSVSARITPWGNVWINDKFAGKSPILRDLDPGTYRIGGGHTRPIMFKNIKIRSGRVQKVQMHITREQVLEAEEKRKGR
ncbi:MAG: protein kinase [Myxococcales bacterium]|nr:MAG: protein kinase [Myxococcales bacterium]